MKRIFSRQKTMVKKLLSLYIVAAALASAAAAQTPTVVSGTVTDLNGVPYSFAKVSAQLIPTTASPTIIVNGIPTQIGGQQNANADANGTFSMSLFCNSAGGGCSVISPSGTQWQITVNINGVPPPAGKGSQACTATLTITGASQSVTSSFSACPALLSGGGATTTSSIPGQPGVTAVPVTSGLMAEYRLLPTENPCAAVDYSGNGNNATGCDGTSPIIQSGTGGFAGVGTGSVILPAALNSAKTVTFFISNNHANGFLIAGNNSGGTNSSAVLITGSAQSPGGQAQGDGVIGTTGTRVLSGWLSGGNPTADYPRVVASGNQSITWVMGASVDQFYFNGAVENFTYNSQRTSAGHQTSGAFELGGISSCSALYTACGFLNSANMYYAIFYNRVLTPQEIAANAQYLATAMAARGVPSTTVSPLGSAPGNILGGYNVVADGDSITCGTCVTNGPSPYTGYAGSNTLLVNGVTPASLTNSGRAGINMISQLEPGAAQAVDPAYAPKAQGNVVIIWGGTNDGGTNMQDSLRSYCTARRLVGWKCLVVSMISRTGSDTTKNTYGAWMRQHWKEFADGFADMASDTALGADGDSASATYFLADNIHPTQTAVDNDEYPIIQRAVDALYGNNDFSTATVYSSPATAAVATTALTESGNTVTVTFAATPANCQVGNSIVIAGVTAAGYNSTAANGAGNGAWTIITRSATQVTYFDATTGLGAATVQGTGVCPQQQNKDVFQILNFGAGNFTLQSCVGYTGQNRYYRNINANPSTLVPFGSETITGGGATPATLAANTTAIIQCQLVSASAAGANPVRIQ